MSQRVRGLRGTSELPGRPALRLSFPHPLLSRSTIGGGQGCNKFVPVLGGEYTRVAPPGDLFDQHPREMS